MTAFACNRCPRSADLSAGGCPVWWEVLERNHVTNAERLTADCGFRIMPRFLTETMRMAHRAAAQSAADRETIGKHIDGAVTAARGLAIAAALAGGRGKPWKAIPGAHDDDGQPKHVREESRGVPQRGGVGHDSGTADDGGLARGLDDVRHDLRQTDLVERFKLAGRNRQPGLTSGLEEEDMRNPSEPR